MYKLSYKEIQTIQENTTKKLIRYINDFLKDDNSLDSVEFYYPDFDDENTMIAFNVWVSIDYKTNYGKTFIEHMLEDRPNGLTNLEREILQERNKSYVSLFEVQRIRDEFVYLEDILIGRSHKIWDPNLSNILQESDVLFGRIGKIIEYQGFIGNVSFLPPTAKDRFIQEFFVDYNRTRFRNPGLGKEEYLKQHSVNLYKIYTECIYDVVEMTDDISSTLYDELSEFESYLSLSLPRYKIKKHINNLINLFEYYLADEEMTLYDLDEIDMEDLVNILIEDGFINCHLELVSYVNSLKKYLGFMRNRSADYQESYDELLNVSKNIFIYMKEIEYTEKPFDINKNAANKLENSLNEQALRLILDFEKFLLYIMNQPLETTKTLQHIKRKNLLELNKIMEIQEEVEKKAPNQIDFPILDLFYHFALDNKLIKLDKGILSTSRKSSQYLWLSDEDKYSLFLDYILSSKFLSSMDPSLDQDILEYAREDILTLLNELKEKVNYKYSVLLVKFWKYPKLILRYSKYLEIVGLLKYNYPEMSISVTSFGKKVFKVLLEDQDEVNNGKVIPLMAYRENR